jgi:hypothetical protein
MHAQKKAAFVLTQDAVVSASLARATAYAMLAQPLTRFEIIAT